MRNAAERKSIRAAEKAARQAELARVEFIVAAMATVQGRAWFHELLSGCQIFAANFANDPFTSGRIEGARNIGLMIYSDIVSHCPDHFVLMMKEAVIKEATNDRRTDPDFPDDDDDGTADGEYPGGED